MDRMWTKVRDDLPKRAGLVRVLTEGGHERDLWYDLDVGFMFPDKSMYVYFTPWVWRYID